MADGKPDAVIVPDSWRQGKTSLDRVSAVLDKVEPILGCKGHIRRQGDYLFITGDPADTINHPTDHYQAGFPRYRWEEQEGDMKGMRFGTLLTEDEVAGVATSETPAMRAKRLADLQAYKDGQQAREAKLLRWRELTTVAARDAAQEAEYRALDAELFAPASVAEPAIVPAKKKG